MLKTQGVRCLWVVLFSKAVYRSPLLAYTEGLQGQREVLSALCLYVSHQEFDAKGRRCCMWREEQGISASIHKWLL